MTSPKLCSVSVATACFLWCKRGRTSVSLWDCSRSTQSAPNVCQRCVRSLRDFQGPNLSDDLDLTVEAGRAALDQRHIGRNAHFVHMPPGLNVV